MGQVTKPIFTYFNLQSYFTKHMEIICLHQAFLDIGKKKIKAKKLKLKQKTLNYLNFLQLC